MLDFLKEIVDGVPDPSAGGTIDIEAEKNEAKRRRGQGAPRKRRKKSEAGEAPESAVEGAAGNGEWPTEHTTTGPGTDGEEDNAESDREWDS